MDTAQEEFLREAVAMFRSQKTLAEKSIEQLTDEELFYQPNGESNSVALVMKHLAGNMMSRWTDFLTTDGEKSTRDRDAEFEVRSDTAHSLKEYWQRGWEVCLHTLDSLRAEDLSKTITIRSEPHTVIKAIIRQISHYGYHVGQIVYLAKMIRNEQWQTLSIPRGDSSKYRTMPPPSSPTPGI